MGTPTPSTRRNTSWLTFAIFGSLAALAAAAFAADALFKPFGIDGRTVVDNVGQVLAALIGSAACAWKATRTASKERRAWTLLALSSGALAIGQVVYAYYDLVLATPNSVPAVVQLAYLGGGPLAIAAILSFWNAPRGTATRWNVWLDGLIIVLSLTFTEWALDLKTTVTAAIHSTDPAAYLPSYYLFVDILIGAVLILGIRRATHHQHGRMLLVLGGLAAISLSDSTFAYLTANNEYTAGDVVDSGWVVGYLMIALAALWPVPEATSVRIRNAPVDLWQLALPLGTVVVSAIVCLILAFSGHSLDGVQTAVVGITSILLTIRVITANREAVAMLIKSRASEGNLAEVIARAPTGFVRINTEFAIIDANPQFSSLLAAVDERLIGFPITRYFSAEEGQRFVDLLQALKVGSVNAVDSDSEAHRADGSVVWLHWSATVVRDEAGDRDDYFIAMFEDTTSRHDSEAAAAATLGLMQRLNSLKTDFLQSVSHEFKTALLGIQGFSELIRDTSELNVEEVRSFAADINLDAVRLDRMVTEMLELDRTESGRADLHLASVDLNVLVQREVRVARGWPEQVLIELDLDPTLKAIPGDEVKLSEVMHTLLANAVKRSPEGGVVTVTTALGTAGVRISVKDQGVGVRAEFDDRLFEQDDLYANSPIRKLVGTGLGLGIARQVVQLHGGRLWVVRTPAGGSEYHFTLPMNWRDRIATPVPAAAAS